MPYVYNVDLTDIKGVVQAAEWYPSIAFHHICLPNFVLTCSLTGLCVDRGWCAMYVSKSFILRWHSWLDGEI